MVLALRVIDPERFLFEDKVHNRAANPINDII
jgi:hypothetical protein